MKELLLLLLALPVVADPPVVLSLTVASPEEACWLLSLDTDMSLSLLTLTWLVNELFIVFSEDGPVLLILLLGGSGIVASDDASAADPVFETLTEAFRELLLLASPVVADPPVVLSVTVASPV